MLVPEYAADSLLPRLRKAIRATLALIPEGSALYSEEQIQQTNSEVMRLVAEILEVANATTKHPSKMPQMRQSGS